jgi:hypothetical protein
MAMGKGTVALILDKMSKKSEDAAPESDDEEPSAVALESAVGKFFAAGKAGDNAKAAAALRRAVSLCSGYKEADDEE